MTSATRTMPIFRVSVIYVFLWCVIALAGCMVYSPASLAESNVEKGLRIAVEADRRNNEFGDSVADLTMLIAASREDIISREMRQMNLEVVDDGDKSIMVFDRPRDLKGTAILTFSHKTEADEQWLYLPALKRVKRISSADKSGPFMGSEFAFEDLSSQEIEKYSYSYLGDETVDGEPYYVVERIPTDKYSGYSRLVTWVDHQEYRLHRVDYYDRKNTLLKTMVAADYQKYLDRFWRPGTMTMTNHQTGKSTTLKFDNYQFRTGLKDSDFSPSAISRIR
jgi:outer membrane lipoprotein-sorting protein